MKFAVLLFPLLATPVHAEMVGTLGAPWDGVNVPKGQHCQLLQGEGSTPPMTLTGLPAGTVAVHLEFNDLTYTPLSTDGGHGIIGIRVTGPDADLPSVPAMTDVLPEPAFVVKKARAPSPYNSDGYLPPCSGGRGNEYSVTVKAVDAADAVLEQVTLPMGRY